MISSSTMSVKARLYTARLGTGYSPKSSPLLVTLHLLHSQQSPLTTHHHLPTLWFFAGAPCHYPGVKRCADCSDSANLFTSMSGYHQWCQSSPLCCSRQLKLFTVFNCYVTFNLPAMSTFTFTVTFTFMCTLRGRGALYP